MTATKYGRPCCEHCDAPNCVKCFRLDTRTWRPTYRLLCSKCQKRFRYTPVDYSRGYFPSIGRRAA